MSKDPSSPPAAAVEYPAVFLRPNEDRRIRRGHLWVFSNEIASAPDGLAPGEPVAFLTSRKELLGVGTYNAHSLIRGRIMERHGTPLDAAFFERKLKTALALRQRLMTDNSYRWVFGESDDLPGLVVDRYGDALVIESYSAGIDRLMPEVLAALNALGSWKSIILRNDVGMRRLEGLPLEVRVVQGNVEKPHRFEAHGLRLAADLEGGQKTGFFFDQRANRQTVADLAGGKRVLDLFCHTGGFGLWAAQAGAAAVVGVDESAPALELALDNARANGFDARMSFHKADAAAYLDSIPDTFDVVVVDPPNYVPSKKQLPAALKAYVRLAAGAMKRVAGEGFLAFAVCAQHVERDMVRQIVSRAAQESGRRVRILQWGGQSPDHPIRPSMPETEYLKFVLCQIV